MAGDFGSGSVEEPAGRSRGETAADLILNRRWWIVAIAAAVVTLGGLWASGLFNDLVVGGFTVVDSDSRRAVELEEATLGRADADVFVVFSSGEWTVDSDEYRAAATAVLSDLPADHVTGVVDYWTSGAEELVNADRSVTYAGIRVVGDDDAEKLENYLEIKDDLDSSEIAVQVGGPVALFDDVNEESKKDLARAEAIALPLLFILLILIFRSAIAALLPIMVGVLSIVGALAALRLIAQFLEVSVFAVNVVTLLGLGMAIDYSLFMVSRFRDELAPAGDIGQALRSTMVTAGRTVAVSAITTTFALSSLLVYPHVFLRSIALGGIAAVTLSLGFSLTFMPAMLAILGPRLTAWNRSEGPVADPEDGRWAQIARAVMRRPLVVAICVVTLLLVLGLPFLRISYGWLDTRVLPASSESRQASEVLDEHFEPNATSPIFAIATLPDENPETLADYLDRLGAVDGVQGTAVTGLEGGIARIGVAYEAEPISTEGRRLIEDLRAVPPPDGVEVLVGGNAAVFADLFDMIVDRLPWMGLIVVLSTFLLLFFSFGSFVVPIKALVLNALSLTAAFGAVVWIFQDGNLTGLLDFTSTGNIDVVQVILILAIAFGLSMDYEVFLLSRIREFYDETGDNAQAVAAGLQSTGSIITNAALLMIVVIGAFATSGVLVVKIIGVGLAVAILVDAAIVRALLAPATMQLLSRANWWAPSWARRIYVRWGTSESEPVRTVDSTDIEVGAPGG